MPAFAKTFKEVRDNMIHDRNNTLTVQYDAIFFLLLSLDSLRILTVSSANILFVVKRNRIIAPTSLFRNFRTLFMSLSSCACRCVSTICKAQRHVEIAKSLVVIGCCYFFRQLLDVCLHQKHMFKLK